MKVHARCSTTVCRNLVLLSGVFSSLCLCSTCSFSAEIPDAAKTGDLAKVQALLHADPAVANSVDNDGRTPLQLAALSRHTEIIEVWLKSGAQVNASDKKGMTALHDAVSKDDVDTVALLLDGGADVNANTRDGLSPLNFAVRGTTRSDQNLSESVASVESSQEAQVPPSQNTGPGLDATNQNGAAADSTTPNFRWGEIDTICVMPVVNNMTTPVDTYTMRPMAMLELQKHGFRVEDPSCANATRQQPLTKPSRWRFKVSVDSVQMLGSQQANGTFAGSVLGIVITASVFDTQTNRNVWSSRAVSTTVFDKSEGGMFDSALRRILKPVALNRKDAHLSAPVNWEPQTVQANVFTVKHGMKCRGTLRVENENVSFTLASDDSKCKEYEFSVPRAEVKSYGIAFKGSGIPTAFSVSLSHKGSIHFCNANATDLAYVFAALGSER